MVLDADFNHEGTWGKAFPSRLLRAPLSFRAGGVPQRPQLSIRPSRPRHSLRSRPGQSFQIEALQRCQAAFLSHLPVIAQAREASPPPQPPRLASLREWQARRFRHPPPQRHCWRCFADASPPFHEALAHSSTAALSITGSGQNWHGGSCRGSVLVGDRSLSMNCSE